MIVVKETAVTATLKSSRHSQEDSDEGGLQGSEESDDETVPVIYHSFVAISKVIYLNFNGRMFFQLIIKYSQQKCKAFV